jgi:hypothetical protein
VFIVECGVVNKFWRRNPISSNMCFLVSVLWTLPNHTPIKLRCPIYLFIFKKITPKYPTCSNYRFWNIWTSLSAKESFIEGTKSTKATILNWTATSFILVLKTCYCTLWMAVQQTQNLSKQTLHILFSVELKFVHCVKWNGLRDLSYNNKCHTSPSLIVT